MSPSIETIHPVFNRTKAPYHNDQQQIITFNLRRYYIPVKATYDALLLRLQNAVGLLWSTDPSLRDLDPLVAVIRELQPYRTNRVVGSQYRQQNTVDAVTKQIVN